MEEGYKVFNRQHQERARKLDDIVKQRLIGQEALFVIDVIDQTEQSEDKED
jgi:hypothetical protein